MDIEQVSKLTLIPVEILARMRKRRGGPPCHKVLTNSGHVVYLYLKSEILKWLTGKTAFFITAGDAAELMGISRDAVMSISGFKGFDVHYNHIFNGRLIVNNGKNQYIWVPSRRKQKSKRR